MASRNPNGRGSRFPGKKPASFTLCPATIDSVKQLAGEVGDSSSDFMEGLARTYGRDYADRLLAQEGTADASEAGGIDEDPGRPGSQSDLVHDAGARSAAAE